MPFPYFKIFKQAYVLVRTHKFLWTYGLFLVVFFLSSFFLRADLFGRSLTPKYLLFAVWFLTLWLFSKSKAGLISAIKAILDGQSTDFGKSFKAANLFYGRIMELIVLASVIVAVISLVLNLSAVSWLLIYLAVFLAINIITELASIFIVVFDLKLAEAAGSSIGLMFKHGPHLVLLSISLMLIASIFFLPFAFIFFPKILGLFLLPIEAVVLVFAQAVWVLAFQELIRPVKLEEDETMAAVLPEVAGG